MGRWIRRDQDEGSEVENVWFGGPMARRGSQMGGELGDSFGRRRWLIVEDALVDLLYSNEITADLQKSHQYAKDECPRATPHE